MILSHTHSAVTKLMKDNFTTLCVHVTRNSAAFCMHVCAWMNKLWVCMCVFECVCVCVCESDSPSVSYSSTKMSFPFLLHTSLLCYFRAMLAELVVSRDHAHANTHTHTHNNMQNTLRVFWRSERSCASFMVCWYNG